jgi:hypothetical protein
MQISRLSTMFNIYKTNKEQPIFPKEKQGENGNIHAIQSLAN